MVAITLKKLSLLDWEFICLVVFQLLRIWVEVTSNSVWAFLFSDNISFTKLVGSFLSNFRIHFTLILHTQESFINLKLKLWPPLVTVIINTGERVSELVVEILLRILWSVLGFFSYFVILFISSDHLETENTLLKSISETEIFLRLIKAHGSMISRSFVFRRVGGFGFKWFNG